MAKCEFCHQRKGKRECPALKGRICTLCCGENRGKAINCPDDCPILHPHESYQRERIVESFVSQRGELLRKSFNPLNEDVLKFLNLLDMVTYANFCQDINVPVSIVLEGFEYLKQRLSPIEVPTQFVPEFGERLWEEVEEFIEERGYSEELAARVVTSNIEFIKEFSQDGKSNFLKGVAGFIERFFPDMAERLKEHAEPAKIILPDR